MKIAVFGGSGVVGRVLLERLVAAGHEVRAMVHQTPVEADGVETLQGDLTDPAAVARTVEGAEVALQMTKGGGGIIQAVETSVRGTLNVLDALRKLDSLRQYLLTSSDAATGICAHPQPRPIDHQTSPKSYPGYYSLGKVLEEVIVGEYVRNYGLPATIARLSWVQQEDSALRLFVANERPGRGPFQEHYTAEQLARLEAGERFVVLPVDDRGESLGRTLVHREDVISALTAMIGSDRAIGETFPVSGPAFRYQDACAYLGEEMDLPVERVTVRGEYGFEIDYSHTTELLGWAPRYDVIALLDAALTWREQHPRQP
mgnify:CR=1 FL=1